ncbi:MAG: LysR family transcriptional regulator [Pseudomonadales bacterium]
MQFRGLRAFCLAAERSSFKEAAQELCVTASAVSHQIRDLESWLGTKLFDRHTRSVELTPAGHQFLAAVQPHMRAIELAAKGLRQDSTQETLTVEMPEFFASEMFLPRLPVFTNQHRHIDLRIATTAPNEVGSQEANIQITLSRHRPIQGETTQLFPIYYQPACSPQVFAQWQSRWHGGYEGLKEATLLVHKARPNAWTQWLEAMGLGSIRARQTIVVDSMYALARTAEQSGGVALIPMPVSQQWLSGGALVNLFAPTLDSADYYWMTAIPSVQESAALQTLCEWIATQFAAMDDGSSSIM